MAAIEQWVNVNPGEQHEKPSSKSAIDNERLGRVGTIQVKFEKPLPACAKFRVVADEDPKEIHKGKTGKELEYPRFQFDPGDAQAATADGATIASRHVEFPAMGGNGYRVEAKYHGTTKLSSDAYTARRRVYFAIVEMELDEKLMKEAKDRAHWDKVANVDEPFVPSDAFAHLQAQLEDAPNQLFIDAYKLERSKAAKLAHRPIDIADTVDHTPFCAALRPLVGELRDRRPGGAIVIVDRIGAKAERSGSDTYDLKDLDGNTYLRVGFDVPLWINHTSAEDELEKHWLVEVAIIALGANGAEIGVQPLPRDAIVADADYPKRIDVKLADCKTVLGSIREKARGSSEVADTINSKFKLAWRLRYCVKEAAGAHLPKTNVLLVARRGQYYPNPAAHMRGSFVHEVGHLLGLVSDGNEPAFLELPDNHHKADPADPHQPRHCKHVSCVMHYPNKKKNKDRNSEPTVYLRGDTFCADCKLILRRTDVSSASGVFGGNVA